MCVSVWMTKKDSEPSERKSSVDRARKLITVGLSWTKQMTVVVRSALTRGLNTSGWG